MLARAIAALVREANGSQRWALIDTFYEREFVFDLDAGGVWWSTLVDAAAAQP